MDLAAPGVSILSTTPNDTYSFFDGTSMATPHVAGAAALLMGYNPSLTNNEIKWRILKGADYKGLPVLTGGRVNINNAILLPSPQVTIEVTPTGSTTVPRGGVIAYNVSIQNTQLTAKTVSAAVVAVFPNGSEAAIIGGSLTLIGNGVFTQDYSITVPSNIALGEYQLVGRVSVPSASFDEDIVIYTIVP